MAKIKEKLAGIRWDLITQTSPTLSRDTAPVLKVSLPANLKHTTYADMTLVEHPDHFGTMVHAREVLERMKVRLLGGSIHWAKY